MELERLRDIELFLLDMDGTINIEYRLIDGAKDFINTLIGQGKKYVFLTNNSSKSGFEYVKKMNKLGLTCSGENVFTSGMAMGMFLRERRAGEKVYLVGTVSLRDELAGYGVEFGDDAGIVVVGFDRELNYEKLENACRLLDNGAEFLATNVDLVCPVENNRYIPDCGSICHMLEVATHRKPRYIGKPNREMVDIIADNLHIPRKRIAIVGDRVYTDIKTGVNAGITTVCVLSGESDMQTIETSGILPDFIFDSVADIYNAIC